MSRDPIEIPLRRRDGSVRAVALIDAVDAHLAQHTWHLGDRYVERNRPGPKRTPKIRLHRQVVGLEDGDRREADHISGDRLDCRRSNLRIATHAENMENVPKRAGLSSRYRGVSFHKASGRWHAYGRKDGQMVSLGRYDDEDEAGEIAAAFRALNMTHANEQRSTA